MSRFSSTIVSSLKLGDVFIRTNGLGATRALITRVKNDGTLTVIDFVDASGADYLAIAPDSHLIVDSIVDPLPIRPVTISQTLYEGQLAYMHTITAGLVAVRVTAIDLDARTCQITVTATRNKTYPRGYVAYGVTFNSIAHRSAIYRRGNKSIETFRPRFSHRWIDYPSARDYRDASN